MARSSVVAIVASALVVFAGCGGVLGGDNGTTTVDVDEESLPPGVSQEGVTNESRLTQAHASRLASTSFTASYERSIKVFAEQGTFQERINQEVKATSGLRRLLINGTAVRGTQTRESQYWANKSLGLVRVQVGNQTRFQKLPASIDRSRRFTFASTLSQLLRVGNYNVTETREVGGETLIVLSASSVNRGLGRGGSDVIDANNVSNVSSKLVVGTEGIIYEFELSFNATTSNGPASYEVSFTVAGTEEVSIQRPNWIGEALANVTYTNLSAGIKEGVIAITHNGGDPVPRGSPVVVQANGSLYQGTVVSPIEPGQTVYLSLNRSAGTVAVVSSADQGTAVTGRVAVVMYTRNQETTLLQATLNASDQATAWEDSSNRITS